VRSDTQSTALGASFTRFTIARAQHHHRNGIDSISFGLDSCSPISLIDRTFYETYFSKSYPSSRTTVPISVSGIGGGQPSNEFAIIELRMRSVDGRYILIRGEFHVIPALSCNMLVGNDTLHTYLGRIDVGRQIATFGPARYRIPITVLKSAKAIPIPTVNVFKPIRRKAPRIRKTRVFATETTVVEPGMGINVRIQHKPLPREKSYLFTPEPMMDLSTGKLASAPKAILGDEPGAIPFSNFGKQPLKIIKNRLLGYIEPLQEDHLGSQVVEDMHVVEVFLGETDLGDNQPYVLQKDRDDDFDPDTADISTHWGEDYEKKMRRVVEKHSHLFRPSLGAFNDGIEMPIKFRDEKDVLGLKSNPYGLSRRDRQEADKILDPLVEDGCVEPVPLGQPSAAASPAFIVWNKGKPRLVIDLRKVNTKLYPDAYPLPKQDEVLGALGGSGIFSSLDMQKSFFQQGIRAQDRWKTAFVTPHRGHEQLAVAPMGLAVTPGFFQHRMEDLLKMFLWKFVLVYIDDIIIFSRTPEEHLRHVDEVLTRLESSGVSLSVKKCHFGYPSIKLLGHHVSRLGYTTEEEKVEAIRQKAFPTKLKGLETGIGFFGYYRKFVENFASIVEPILRLKTIGFKTCPIKGRPRERYASNTDVLLNQNIERIPPKIRAEIIRKAKEAWELLKEKLTTAPVLAYPDFSKAFKLYVDGSKEHGFGAAVHQTQDGVERPILFLSRCLKPSEKGYWATELETAALVWALQKVPFYFDSGEFEVITDHSAILGLHKEARGRRSQRLDEWALFLSKFAPRMKITHRAGKQHANADGLSRLHDEETVGDTPVKNVGTDCNRTESFPVTIIGLDKQFMDDIQSGMEKDKAFATVIAKLEDQKNLALRAGECLDNRKWAYHSFFIGEDGLLYQAKADKAPRLCIPGSVERRLFELAHDSSAHTGLKRAYDKLYEIVFIPRLREKLKIYIASCPICQRSKPARHKPYGELQPIPIPSHPFQVISIDFVTALPVAHRYDSIATITCKYTKFIRIVPGQETWTAEQWATAFFDGVVRHHLLPKVIVSDRDAKFTGLFWKHLLQKCRIKSHMTAAYHPSADGQAERTNQSVEIAMRCILTGNYEEHWPEVIPEVERNLNTLRNASTGITPFEALYGYPPNYRLDSTSNLAEADNFMENRELVRKDLENAMELANARMAVYFDDQHRPPNLTGKVFIKLVKGGQKGYQLPRSSKLSTIKMGPYPIKRRIGELAYELDLPAHTRIHPVISCIHLEQYVEDPYQREIPNPTPVIVDREQEWVVEKLVKERGPATKREILVKWKGFSEEDSSWEPRFNLEQDVPDMLAKFDKRPKRGRPR
jgi:RNase H-like domain found in reverse transcriptase/Reverse transcriptase (RNA-dependent DNA polymerase)/Integrase zinc binding domain/Chromo (CHRromatin Organisation MOdifier) domain